MLLNRHVQTALGFVAVAALAGVQEEVAAATLEVTASIPDSCSVTGGTLAFGTVNLAGGSDVPGSGQINIDCTAVASVSIALDGGLNYQAGNNGRSMKRLNSNDYLDYRLYTAGFAQERQVDAPIPVPGDLNIGTNVIVVDGLVEGSQNAPGGDYSDTVQITLTFN